MTDFDFGDVVLIRFPFSDGRKSVQRPALVLYDNRDLDLLLCRVTTKPYNSKTDFKFLDWKGAGLLKTFYVRLGKMATLEKGMVNRRLGNLGHSDSAQAKEILKAMFEL